MKLSVVSNSQIQPVNRNAEFEIDSRDKLISIATQSSSTLLITGPTGSGKTTLAESIHRSSPRKNGPFVTINLAGIHENLLESELFGHERGSFTGATQTRQGKLEGAQGGTVFLDEIGELPLHLQSRLLQFLQTKRLTPVGSNREVQLDVRVIVATHRDLAQDVKLGKFREDLYFRIRVLEMKLPALKNRFEDFGEIVHDCIEVLSKELKKSVKSLDPEVANILEAHPWPGNFRELRNALEYAILSSEDGVIRKRDLPVWIRQSEVEETLFAAEKILGHVEVPLLSHYDLTMAYFERAYLKVVLNQNQGRVNQSARSIQMNKTTLLRRLREHGLRGVPEREDFPPPAA